MTMTRPQHCATLFVGFNPPVTCPVCCLAVQLFVPLGFQVAGVLAAPVWQELPVVMTTTHLF